ncbi:sushi, von Willebrand factor type A, EGF and pentraxin domain-containing protein 1-like isoform X2 [Mytilus californianus]|uniref:sushi, von Willebrand factor type A, EGF and pentraxin domain-containing protein 1-like isoform X2 n=1 Tax=Mytilus californianus TaxID=6549 RepID=UPI00224818A5|nr:sushi, von Willebrand factor type A, EGF and pentraxin domain-containing protein 1-like isoform X2 [Mytilus californianus]
MMTLKIVVAVISFFTVNVFGENEKHCPVSALTKHFHVRQTYPAVKDFIPHGTTLTVKCKSTREFSWAFCQSGQWTVEDKECSSTITKELAKPLKRRKRFFFLGLIVRFVARFVSSIFSNPRPRPRDTTRPQIRNCPPDRTVTAIPIQLHAFVDWTPPSAWDNRDGQISVHMNGPYRSGGPFFERDGRPTTVGYYARDQAGNMATCNFNIYVKVIRCPVRSSTIPDGYRVCHPSSDMVLGTVCWYGCYQGHILKGAPSRIECLETGQWSSQNEPYCEKKQCSPIVQRGQLSFSCTADFYFRSTCTYGCDAGFDIPANQRRAKVCLASGTWNGYDPDCVDVEPPSIEQCPNTLMFYPGNNKDTAVIFWNRPVVVDNKDKGLEPTQILGPPPASEQGVNTYTIKYTVQDLAGNEGEECSFDIVIKQLRCPKLYPLPYMKLNCTGTRRGSECSFSCQDNSVLVGQRNTYCKRNGEDPYAKWAMDYQPFCELSNGCPDLTPPDNGAIACDVWVGGRYCHPLCSQGYSVLSSLPNFLICQDNGIWTNHNKLKDCFDTSNSRRRYVTMEAEFYFTGNCNDPTTQAEIKEKYMTAITNSNSFLVKKMCMTPECNIGNVKVICPTTSKKRSTDNMIINTDISFESGNGTLTSQQYETEVNTFTEFMNSLETELKSDNFTLVINDQHAHLLEMTANDLELDCPDNSVPVFSTIVACVQCPPGTFYDGSSKTCSTCFRGSYQPHSAQDDCTPCPFTQTTARIGAIDVLECEDACKPGTWSLTGVPPCVECDVGYYESNYGSTVCKQCPGNYITLMEKSDNVSYCVDYDVVFPNSTEPAYTELQITDISLQKPFVVTFHIQCQTTCQGTFFRMISSASDHIELTSSLFTINTNTHVAFDSLEFSKKWFHISLHIGRNKSSSFVDGEMHKAYENNIEFSQNVDLNITLGGDDFIGAISQFSIVSQQEYTNNEHLYSKCDSEGVPSGIVNWNEFAYSNLINGYINIPSKCDDYDDCQINPCVNGNCTDKLGGYTCACDTGFTGSKCDINIDDCVAHACQNNATCIDEVNDYSCSCDYEYTGELCEVAMVDGSWSDWDNWTECSASCGNGTIQRQRACADPLPDNGGKVCEGPDTEIEVCSLEPCRECTELVEPSNSSLICVNNSNTITCVLNCDEGFDYDHDVKDEYVCGNETYYYWDFQTNNNPYGRLPYCTEVVHSFKMHVDHTAHYDLGGCDTPSTADIENKITARIESATQQLTCVTSNMCTMSSNEVINCGISRKKRDTSTFVGFTVKLTCDTTTHGTETCFYALEDAVKELEELENRNELDLPHNSIIYKIVQNSSSSDGSLNCPSGTIPFIAYCVPCSIGHYYSNDECLSCAIGTYQDQTGQTFCFSCPKGMTTEGTDSVSIDDCNVPTPISSEENKLSIILAVCISIPILVIIVIVNVVICRQNGIFKSYKKRFEQNESKKLKGNCDKVGKPRMNSKTITTIQSSVFSNDGFEFDTITLGISSPPPVSFSFSPTKPKHGEAKNIMNLSEDENGRPIPPRECWTPESVNGIEVDC